jgi:hypothetical protein
LALAKHGLENADNVFPRRAYNSWLGAVFLRDDEDGAEIVMILLENAPHR